MGNGGSTHGDGCQRTLGGFAAFADGIGHFVGFSGSVANLTLTVADNHESAEAETTSTFNHF